MSELCGTSSLWRSWTSTIPNCDGYAHPIKTCRRFKHNYFICFCWSDCRQRCLSACVRVFLSFDTFCAFFNFTNIWFVSDLKTKHLRNRISCVRPRKCHRNSFYVLLIQLVLLWFDFMPLRSLFVPTQTVHHVTCTRSLGLSRGTHPLRFRGTTPALLNWILLLINSRLFVCLVTQSRVGTGLWAARWNSEGRSVFKTHASTRPHSLVIGSWSC